MSHQHSPNSKHLEEIWEQVPVDYYQKGVSSNIFQRIWHTNKLRQVVNAIKNTGNTPKNILDVGCASGWFLNELSQKFPDAKCTGVDVYKKAILYGRKNYKNLMLHHLDAHKLPFPDKSFDIVICCSVLDHVVDAGTVLEEMKRVLKPKGRLIVEIDSGGMLFRIVWFLWTNVLHGVWRNAHLHTFNLEILEDLFIKSGFRIEKKNIFNATMAVVFVLSPQK